MITLVNSVMPHEVARGMHVPPPGVLSLASAIRESDVQVRFLDVANLGEHWPLAPEDLPALLGDIPPMVGFSTMSNMLPFTVEAARALKAVSPQTTIVFGGCGTQAALEGILTKFPFVDFAFYGEGEECVPKFLQSYPHSGSWREVAGLAYRQNGQVIVNPPPRRIAQLDALPMPAYDLVDFASYSPTITLMTSRGCPFCCSYCESVAFWERRVTSYSVPRLFAEIKLLRTAHGVSSFGFSDDTFTASRKRASEFCREYIRGGWDFHWGCAARVDGVEPELMKLLAQANCQDFYFGVESGSDRTLRAIRKGVTRDQICDVVPRAREHFSRVIASFMWGFPFEELADLEETLLLAAYLRSCDVQAQLHLWSPMTRSSLFEQYRDQLVYDPAVQSNIVLGEVKRYEKLIRSHPEIFAPFYHVPHPDFERKKRMVEAMGFSG
jgi:anaerobic magnesium-protoporphyrin IX monomethyl ester cyclase